MDLSEVSKFETRIGVIKLSQAIREGAKMGHQCHDALTDYRGGTCALGAALTALDVWPRHPMTFLAEYFGVGPTTLQRVVKLNDKARMSREAIANWLEKRGY